MSATYFALLPAAGSGERLGLPVNKAAVEIAGLPMASHSVRVIDATPGLMGGALIVHPRDEVAAVDWIRRAAVEVSRWQVVIGGADRRESVARGFEVSPDVDRILVHDAARPLLSARDRDAVVACAAQHGAAILAHRVVDTVKRVSSAGEIRQTVDRSELWGAETPQIVRPSDLRRALDTVSDEVTDEAGWMESLGIPVRVVESTDPNFKITVPVDLRLAEWILGGDRAPGNGGSPA